MLDVFINPDDEIEVKIAIGTSKSDPKLILADVSVEKLREVYKDDIDSIEEHTIWFRSKNYNDQIKIVGGAIEVKNDSYQINPQTFRYNRIVQLVKRWTFKNKSGEIPPTEENIKKLHPAIAHIIEMVFESKMTDMGLS